MSKRLSKSKLQICKTLLANGRLSISEISNQTQLPTWKVSRNLKKLELKEIVTHKVEDRNKRGRPRKFYKLCSKKETISPRED